MANEKPSLGEAALFLDHFGSFSKTLQPGISRLYTDKAEASTLQSLSRSFETQTQELAAVFRSALERAPAQIVADANSLVRIMGVLPLAEDLPNLASELGTSNARFSFSSIFSIIKKIFNALKDLLAKFLPEWVIKALSAILEIIDEILNQKMSINAPEDSLMLSKLHKAYLGELAALARLEREQAWKHGGDSEAD